MQIHKSAAALAAAALLYLACAIGAVAQDQDNNNQSPLSVPGAARGAFGRFGAQPVVVTGAQLAEMKARYIPPNAVPYPADNPTTPNKIELGKKLFFDPALSANGRIACASCHDVRRGFSGGTGFSLGVKGERLARHSPTIMNLAWLDSYFWDGRAASLEQQALMPIADAREMGMPHEVMVSRLAADSGYRQMFERAFPGEPLNALTVGKALASFERTLSFADSPFDRWIAGDDNAISDSAKRGFIFFNTRSGCAQCHSGWNFSDGKFHDIGVRGDDLGRFGVEADESLKHAFKTPGLRNIALRAPYMHNGQLNSLGEVMRFYNGDFLRRATLAPEMRRVRVGGTDRDIIAFMQTLTSPIPPDLLRLQEELDRQTGKAP